MDELTGLPLAFGKQSNQKQQFGNTKNIGKTKRTPSTTTESAQAIKGEVGTDEINQQPSTTSQLDDDHSNSTPLDEVEPSVDEEQGDLPITHEVILSDHSKTVSAMSLDPSGARLVTGSYDYDLKIWDFGGMKSDFKPFRSFESRAGHQVVDVKFSISGDSFLVANGSDQVKYYDRDGAEIGEFIKGDMYIRDLRHTSGHISSISSLSWHPTNASLFLTSSSDSTLRIWDKSDRRKSKSVIVVKSKERGGKSKITCCEWSRDGKLIACAAEDGSLNLWKSNGNFTRPDYSNDKAHEKGTVTSGIAFSPNGKYLATRGGDGTVKLWNPKSLKKPLSIISSLPSLNSETSLSFSPTGNYLLTGTAGSKAGVLSGSGSNSDETRAQELEKEFGKRKGEVIVLSLDEEVGSLSLKEKIPISDYSVIKVIWHDKINQILASTASGSIHVLYSPSLSTKGALLGLTRHARKATIESTFSSAINELDRPIIAPHSLPMFKDDPSNGGTSAGGRGGKRKRDRERHDPQKTLKPTPPITGPGRGGRVGASATQHVVQGMIKSNLRDQDPREALLKYATSDPNDNTWTSAWKETQPKTVFDERSDSDDDIVAERRK